RKANSAFKHVDRISAKTTDTLKTTIDHGKLKATGKIADKSDSKKWAEKYMARIKEFQRFINRIETAVAALKENATDADAIAQCLICFYDDLLPSKNIDAIKAMISKINAMLNAPAPVLPIATDSTTDATAPATNNTTSTSSTGSTAGATAGTGTSSASSGTTAPATSNTASSTSTMNTMKPVAA
ncbi:hypothetical protein EBR77_03115, partial [bacterium]|nr:hypothetical protein [bacterium]